MERWFAELFPAGEPERYKGDFYKFMIESLGEEVIVTDRTGTVIFANPASTTWIGISVTDLIGKNVDDLVSEGYYNVSSTREAIKAGHTVTILQKLRTGRTLLATSVPLFDEKHERLEMVITTSKDVDEINDLMTTVNRQEQELQLKGEALDAMREDIFDEVGLITRSSQMASIKDMLARIAPLDVTVLIEGETGVGKGIVAKALHWFSPRKNGPFVRINCGAIPETLMESTLFGYEPGAFTGAEKSGKRGMIELADGGTLFLDEIGEMPLSSQVKLLEFLQDGTFSRVGGGGEKRVDVRVIAATNADLRARCDTGLFRKDLYFRLNVIPMHIPPLRERVGDMQALITYFISRLNAKYRTVKTISTAAVHVLMTYSWPGNVRELEHVVERLYVSSEDIRIERENVEEVLREGTAMEAPASPAGFRSIGGKSLKDARIQFENQIVKEAYDLTGSSYKAASLLKVDQSTVIRILKRAKCGGKTL
ncbi:MAG: sigma 54-interacting transcriptional regulator [Clostridiales Family XIII bacterium]|jgi:PAS domain S-box-containing protein|nr:sigma 54-interacting transcriptional regulator [Clostridiales Family XIII bacterium]